MIELFTYSTFIIKSLIFLLMCTTKTAQQSWFHSVLAAGVVLAGSVVPVEAGLLDALSGRRAGGAGGTTVLHIAAAHRLHTGQKKQVSHSMAHINSVVFVQTVTVSWSRSDW